MSNMQGFTPFGHYQRVRRVEQDLFLPGYNDTYKAVDAPGEEHIDPETGLLKVDIETRKIIYRQWKDYNILPGSITGNFEMVAAGPTPEGVTSMLPFVARKREMPFIITSDIGVRNGIDVIHRLGNGGPAVQTYRSTDLKGRENIIDPNDPVWELLARTHERTGKEVFAEVEGADLTYLENTYERYRKRVKFFYRDLRRIQRDSFDGWFMSYGAESAAVSHWDLRYMFTQLFFGLKHPQSENPLETGEVYPFAAILAKKSKEYHSVEGTNHIACPVDENAVHDLLKDFPIHYDLETTKYSYRPGHDGVMVLTGYATRLFNC